MNVLSVPMPLNDAGAKNIREFFVLLAAAVWEQGEQFSGKRPWGYSSWDSPVYAALINAGLIYGTFDADGYLEDFDQPAADALIAAALKELARDSR
jgi:hypothetical protein